MAREGFGTDPSGILARGAPGASGRDTGGASVSVGGVGRAMPTIYPGVSAGRGLGGTLKIPIATPAVKKYAKGGSTKKMAKGGSTASKRADGCATKGKTKGRFV